MFDGPHGLSIPITIDIRPHPNVVFVNEGQHRFEPFVPRATSYPSLVVNIPCVCKKRWQWHRSDMWMSGGCVTYMGGEDISR